jgi:hypothetical protein
MTKGSNSVLLYPNIELKDPILVKEALLLYENLYRIVPSDYKPKDDPEIQQCNEDFEIVASISPEKYTEETYQKFQTKVKKWSHIAAGFSSTKINRSSRLHEGKVYDELRKYLIDEGLLIKDGRWLRGNNALVANYMIYLSNEIATQNQLRLLTNVSPAWTTQEFINYDGNYNEIPYEQVHYTDFSGRSLIGLYLIDFIPKNIAKIPFSEIMVFRDEYQKERENFLLEQSHFIDELQKINDPLVLNDRIRSLQSRLQTALRDYRDACKKLGAKQFFGAKIVTVPLVMPVASFLTSNDPGLTLALSSVGIAFGGLWTLDSYFDKRDQLQKKNPYSYLDLLEKYSFQSIENVNSQLSSEMKEFILD